MTTATATPKKKTATRKPAAKKTTPKKRAAAKKTTTKESSTKKKSASSNGKLSKVQRRLLETLAKSKTVLFKGHSDKGALTYQAIADESGMAINNLTRYMATESRSGTAYPDSLCSLGYAKAEQIELTDKDGGSKNSPILFSITPKGLKALKES